MTDTRVDPDLVATVRQLFREHSTPEVAAQSEADGTYAEKLWREVTEMGLHLVGIDEAAGGSGGTLLDALAILHAAGEYAAPIPLAETMLAARMLADAGVAIPGGPLTVTINHNGLTGVARRVAWGRDAAAVIGIAEGSVFTSKPQVVSEGVDLAGQPSDELQLDGEVLGQATIDLELLGRLFRSAQIAGALEAIAGITRQYVGERVQFGKPVGSFQAVQQHVVTLAQMATMTSLNVDRAGLAAMRGRAYFEITALKQVADKNASLAVRAAHQAHGAIGMTQEYRLQLFTRRLYAWRGEFGDEQQLALELGEAIAAHGSLHDVIVHGSAVLQD